MLGKKPWYLEYLLIIVGTGLMGTAITSCFDAAGMVTGGFSGIAILVKAWTKGLYGNGIPLWITNLILNVPLFLLATKIKGFAFVRKALLGDISLTIWLAILPAWKLSEDFLLVALYGGLLQGIGIGFVFLGGGTTGGTDMLAAIIQKYLRHYSIAQIMQFIDGAIVVVGMYVFGVERALYAIIAVFLVTKVSDGIIEGLKFSKSVYIITDKPDEVSRMVMEDLDRGITGISARGMYSGEDKLMLFCVVGKKELVHLKEKIDEIDENFVLKIRDRLKRLNPELVLIGETWAEGKRLLNGCEMDSIMNYSFRQAMLDFFAERSINAETFGHRLETALSRHPDETNMAMFNALDTHDTKRFINSCSHRLDSFKLGVVVQMMFPGSPSIYYGDEAGIDGENDPDCRKCMTWQENPGEKESFRFYQRLIQFRKKHSAIRNGSFTTVLADGRVYGFARENETEIIEIFVNDSDDTVEITVENARSILISKGNFYIVCRKNGEIIEEICS